MVSLVTNSWVPFFSSDEEDVDRNDLLPVKPWIFLDSGS